MIRPPLDPGELARARLAIPGPRGAAARLTPGRLWYLAFHVPRQWLTRGMGHEWRRLRAKQHLHTALAGWNPPSPPVGAQIVAHYVAGAGHAALAVLAAHSLQAASDRPVQPVLHDDGTLRAVDVALVMSHFPCARVVPAAEAESHLDQTLPRDRFPFLRAVRLGYPHLRKLTDIHTTPDAGPWRIVLDADVFFHRHPATLLAAIDDPSAVHMVDCAPAYGVPVEALSRIAGAPVHPQANVGIVHLPAHAVDWEFLEWAAARILADHGFTYYFEQALTALLLARCKATPLPADDYLVQPTVAQAQAANHAALHYVNASCDYLWFHAWRELVARLATKTAEGSR